MTLFKSHTQLLGWLTGMALSGCIIQTDNGNNYIPNETDFLTNNTWVTTSLSIEPSIAGTHDLFSGMPSCDKDNTYLFNSNLEFRIEEGATKCYPDAPQIIHQGSWQFAPDYSELELTTDSINLVFAIQTLNDSTMEVSYLQQIDGQEYNIRQSFGSID